jgi:hypothetical protein
MILSVVAMRGSWISIAALYSTVQGKASFIDLGYFIFIILWGLVIWVDWAGKNLSPAPFIYVCFIQHCDSLKDPEKFRAWVNVKPAKQRLQAQSQLFSRCFP